MSYLVLTKPGCSYCTRAKALLKANNLPFSESAYDTPEKIKRFKDMGYKTFPQIFHDGTHVGGHDDLVEYLDI